MTADDTELRARLARLDPAGPGTAVEPVDGPRVATELERVMQTDLTTDDLSRTNAPAGRRRPWLIGAAAAAVAGVALGAAFLLGGGDDATTTDKPTTTLALNAPAAAGGTTMQSCIMFDVNFLREMPVAFGGTVTDVQPDKVTVDVDHWYKGGTADVVTVAVLDGSTVALDGVEFTAGQKYLITATDGTVNTCGFSGPATPELTKSFDEAFGT
ncbi:MAG: hypothetical protein JJD92_12880 [Frankiaceae bacterium]|nr:hypothetical protein [Frankiaceae bacterium]